MKMKLIGLIILIYFFVACKGSINDAQEEQIEYIETDSTTSVIYHSKNIEICSLFYDRNKTKIKIIDRYNLIDGQKKWNNSQKFFLSGLIKDSLKISNSGLFYHVKSYREDGLYLGKKEFLLKSNELNQYWYYGESGELLKGYGIYHEIFIQEVEENKVNIQVSNAYDSNCSNIKSFDLYIGNYNSEFKLIDSTNLLVFKNQNFNDTITISNSNRKNEIRYIIYLTCESYDYDGVTRKNVRIPIFGCRIPLSRI